jgi:hypothetical protein
VTRRWRTRRRSAPSSPGCAGWRTAEVLDGRLPGPTSPDGVSRHQRHLRRRALVLLQADHPGDALAGGCEAGTPRRAPRRPR